MTRVRSSFFVKRACNNPGETDQELGTWWPPLQAASPHWGLEGTWVWCPRRAPAFPRSVLDNMQGTSPRLSPCTPTWSHFFWHLFHLPTISQICQKWCLVLSFPLLLLDHLWKRRGNISITSASTINTSLRRGELRQKAGVVAVERTSIRYLDAVGGRIQIWEHRGWWGWEVAGTQTARSAVLGEAPNLHWTGGGAERPTGRFLGGFQQGFHQNSI